jgi:dihydrofolate reductase
MHRIGAIVMGSPTYEFLLGFEEWPHTEQVTWVLGSRALPTPVGAEVRFARGEVDELRDAIDASAGERDVWIAGGGVVARQWLAAGAIDELIIFIAPLLLGSGVPLFGSVAVSQLELRSARAHPGGLVELRYDA